MDTFDERLRKAMQEKDLRQSDLVLRTGIDKALIHYYINGKYKPKQPNIHKIAKALGVSESWLTGTSDEATRSFPNIFSITTTKIPMLGEISCGQPIWMDEDRESYVAAGTNLKADFCLRASGDSMINARILDGDIVFIQKSDIVENGEIAAVRIGEEATLKRVYYYPNENKIILVAENPKYPPMSYQGHELDEISILGRAVAFQSDVR